jgi:hypothetical protein
MKKIYLLTFILLIFGSIHGQKKIKIIMTPNGLLGLIMEQHGAVPI